ncbi:RDD family protein [Mycobacterium sp. SMC-4]|uniref:RDD family protein n=1 Tax=Mycobacterium sp. SMC-4 TaxID=2857059 RepID=UPI0021B344E2|nr:RDD family protein [Mycobacterium sp. SMC-4]UXA18293.1 RDD family protein [Mycobacterium sp. SMC-4]
MTAVLDSTATPDHETTTETPALASWPARAGALAIDVIVPLGVAVTMALLALSAPADGWARWVFTAGFALALLAIGVNRLLLPVATGWTLGRALFGIAVRRADDGNPEVLRLTARDAAHLLDTAALFAGWLWPLWERRRRTFADLLAGTEVRRVPAPDRDMRRTVAGALVGASVLCAAAVGLGYVAVYRQERAIDTARVQITEQGPRIVEQMLSYGTETIDEDFARAQALTTDAYRDQLVAQQQAVRQGDATSNEYWAVSSAVLPNPPVTPDRAAMLLAMQGQRGADAADLKFITATVRVEFEKSGDGQWRVANLTVLKAPQMNPAGQ